MKNAENEKLRSFGEDMRDHTQRIKEDVDAAAEVVGKDLKDTARKAGRHLRKIANSAGDDAGEVMEDIVDRIRDNPVQSIGVALGAGFLIGLLSRGRR